MNDNQRQQHIIIYRRKAMWIMVAISVGVALVLGAVRHGEVVLAETTAQHLATLMLAAGTAAVLFMVMLAYAVRGAVWAGLLLAGSLLVPVLGLVGICLMNYQASVRLRQLREQSPVQPTSE